MALILVFLPVAHAEIYKCTDEHGNVAYLQLPCPAPKEEAVPEVEADPSPADFVESTVQAEAIESSRLPDEVLGDCKKRYRDQIDEIDLEMRRGYSSEQGEVFKDELRVLTQQLRACGS
jgi:hypothetical protein